MATKDKTTAALVAQAEALTQQVEADTTSLLVSAEEFQIVTQEQMNKLQVKY